MTRVQVMILNDDMCGGLFTLMGRNSSATPRPMSQWVRESGLTSWGYTASQLMRMPGMPNTQTARERYGKLDVANVVTAE